MLDRLLPGVSHLQNIHPVGVHFPIGFLLGATAFYFLAWIVRRETLAWAAFWMLTAGVVTGAISVATGLYAAPGVMVAPSVRENLLVFHKWIMIGVGMFATAMLIWALVARPMPTRARYIFLLGLLVMAAALARGADYGAQMVYDYNAGGGACQQPIEYTPSGSPIMGP